MDETYVEPTHGDTNVEEDGAKDAHSNGKCGNHVVRDAEYLLFGCMRVDVALEYDQLVNTVWCKNACLVNVVGQDTGNGNELGAGGTSDCQEE